MILNRNSDNLSLIIAYVWGQMTMTCGLVNDADVVKNIVEHAKKENLPIKVTVKDVKRVKNTLLKVKLIELVEPSNTPMLVHRGCYA